MKTHWKIPVICLQLLLALCLLLGTQATVKAYQIDEGIAAYKAEDYQGALEIFKPLAKQGNASAQNYLGIMYENYQIVEQDYAEAEKWYRKAAEQGYAAAQYNLGWRLQNKGGGQVQFYNEAVKWYRMAADQGHTRAQARLAYFYENGITLEIPRSVKKALKWYSKVAKQGEPLALLWFGDIYNYGGNDVPQDYTEAIKWYRMAADQGDAEAQRRLGLMYLEGHGVSEDKVQAHKWFNLSQSSTISRYAPYTKGDREKIEKKMTPAQVAEAQKLAREWKPKTWEELSQQN